jgi:hypothetical protein
MKKEKTLRIILSFCLLLGKRTDPNPPLAPPGRGIVFNRNPILKVVAVSYLDSYRQTFVKGDPINFQIPSRTRL